MSEPRTERARATRIRWWTLAGLTVFAFVSYMERVNISVAAEVMIPSLGFSKVQMGQIFSSFLIGYAIFQVPCGWLGDRFGPRIVLAVSALIWGVATLATPLLPYLFGGTVIANFVTLWVVRFVLGAGQATTFPVGNYVVSQWMPPGKRAMGTSIMLLGTTSASAATGPLVSWVMLRLGWQRSFYVTALPAFLIAIVWYVFARDTPKKHPRVNDAERLLIQPEVLCQARQSLTLPVDGSFETERMGMAAAAGTSAPTLLALLRQRNVLLLVLSYTSEGYVLFIFVFWIYIYLVERRGFSLMRGGWVAALPWLTAMALVPIGGLACDWLSARHGRLAGARAVIMVGYGLSGLLLFLAAYADAAWLSVAALCLSIGCLMGAESAFWATATMLAKDKVGSLSGVMNAAGIVGGIASTSLMPILVNHFGWLPALSSGALMALLCMLLWTVMVERPREVSGVLQEEP